MSESEEEQTTELDLSKQYEEKFSYKYGDDDEYFAEAMKKKICPPPCIYPWYSKPKRNFDYTRGRSGRRDDDRGDDRRFDRRNNYRHQPYNRHHNQRDDNRHSHSHSYSHSHPKYKTVN